MPEIMQVELAKFGPEGPTTFERDRRGFASSFEIYADRKDKPFVMLSSGLSHNGGRIQHIMSHEDAEALGVALINAARFAREPMLGGSNKGGPS